jgi:hypothetical protein
MIRSQSDPVEDPGNANRKPPAVAYDVSLRLG